MSTPSIIGALPGQQGRCAHYHGPLDVVANLCATCGQYFACFQCHREHTTHPFGRVAVQHPASVLCGVCSATLSYSTYASSAGCPGCGHGFNPGCAAHVPLYFDLPE